MPSSFEVDLYNDLTFIDDTTFEAVTFYDFTGAGEFRMLAAIKSPGAVSIYSFDDAINPE